MQLWSSTSMDNIFFHKTDQLLHCLIPWCVPSLRLTCLLCMPNCENCISRRKSWIWPAQEDCKAVILKLNETFSQGSGGSMVCVDNQTNTNANTKAHAQSKSHTHSHSCIEPCQLSIIFSITISTFFKFIPQSSCSFLSEVISTPFKSIT